MIKPKEIEMGGVTFYINNLSPLTAVSVIKKVTALVGAAMADTQAEIFAALGPALKGLSDSELTTILLQLCSCVQAVKPGDPPFSIDSEASFNKAFAEQDPDNIFIVAFEVMRHNRFPLVREVEGDIGTILKEMFSSPEEEENENENQRK